MRCTTISLCLGLVRTLVKSNKFKRVVYRTQTYTPKRKKTAFVAMQHANAGYPVFAHTPSKRERRIETHFIYS